MAISSGVWGVHAGTTTLPASLALDPSTSTDRGFAVRVVQAPPDTQIGNSYLRAIRQLNGTLVDASGNPVSNDAVAGPEAGGLSHVDAVNFERDAIPFDLTDIEGNYLTSFSPGYFPGIPGNGGTTDLFAVEVVGWVELPVGETTFGVTVATDRTDVNDDDSYVVTTAANPRDFFGVKIGEFERFAPPFKADSRNENQWTVNVTAPGLYPMRLVYWQNGRGAALQWYTVTSDGTRILLNDTSDPRGLRVFRSNSNVEASGPYVAEVTPSPGSDGNKASSPVTAIIIDGASTVATSGVKLTLNGAAVTPQSLSKSGNKISLQYDPNASRTTANNAVALTYTDSVSKARTANWNFGIIVAGGSSTRVAGQWDFDAGDLRATVGTALAYFDGDNGVTKAGTVFGTTSALGLPTINGRDAKVMEVPGALDRNIGYVMTHGIAPNGGGTKVNQYTLVLDVFVDTSGPGAASLLQTSSLGNTDDGDLFWQGSNFGQGGGGYNGRGTFTAGAWHRVVAAYDMAATPPVVTKYVDGIKQDDWTANQGLDAPRRALQPTAILFGDGDQDERRKMWVNSIQIRNGKISDAEAFALGGPSADGIPADIKSTPVAGQWDFSFGDLGASIGKPLAYFDGAEGVTKAGTQFGTTTEFGISDINGAEAKVMRVPGELDRNIGYIMTHRIAPNGGGAKVNQYTIAFDIYVETSGPGAASLLQTSSLGNTDDGDLFWQGSNFGQGGGGYNGRGTFTAGAWHRVVAAYDMAATPPVVTKYVDGIKQDDWTANQGLDAPRRALQPTALLFADGDQDERRVMYVNAIQIRPGKLTDAQCAWLGGPSANGIPVFIPASTVSGQWDFEFGDLGATVGTPLAYLDGAEGVTKNGTQFGTTTSFGIANIDGAEAKVMRVPGELDRNIGYIMTHRIAPNGGGAKVNQYTIAFDIYVETSGPGAASLLQTSSLGNTDDGDLFWQGSNFGQGGGGYNGRGTFTAGAWHRVVAAYDMAATPPVVTKYVDGIKQDDWTANQGLDAPRRALQPTALLFADGDQDERRVMYVSSIQVRAGKLSDAQCALLGGPSASGIPIALPESNVTGQWDFEFGDLGATVGAPLAYLDGADGLTKAGTEFITVDIGGAPAKAMKVPGDLDRNIGYIMTHRIAPNGGGSKVNQYTIAFDIYVAPSGPGAASLLQISSLSNTDDGDLFWQGSNFGQGGGGYNGTGAFTAGAWHRVVAAYDMAATPPVVTKYVDGIKQDDWTANQGLDAPRRALQPTALLFADGDQDERREKWVSSIQIRSGRLSNSDIEALGGPSASGIPIAIPTAMTPVVTVVDGNAPSGLVGTPLANIVVDDATGTITADLPANGQGFLTISPKRLIKSVSAQGGKLVIRY
ncbi:MAG: hypothetical protein WCR07_08600 [Verrucomicrobiota bacterium]